MTTSLIPVCFSPRQSVPKNGSYSPSAGKPALVAKAIQDAKFPVQMVPPRGLLFAELARVHAPSYVHKVLTCKEANGFGNRDRRVAESLPYTSGSMLEAALWASPDVPACSLSSGFHHAGYDFGGGFCTFNGLMVTAAALLSAGSSERVAILDCDAHYGNGTDDILRRLPALAAKICHRSIGKSHTSHRAYLKKVDEALADILRFKPSVILFQAGADPHEHDPLGGYISTKEMRERDRTVFLAARKAGIPVAWNLAGGYQRGGATGIDPVLALHLNTFEEACWAYGLNF